MTLWATWWLWAAAALALGIIEMLAPGFIFLGFAAGAAMVAIILGVGGPGAALLASSLPVLLVAFAIFSLVAWLLFRRIFGTRDGSVRTFDHDINDDLDR